MSDTAGVRGPRGEYAKSARRRDEILDGALQVFSEYGFRDGSLRDIAERVGMTHAGMRHHFPTKVALLAAVLQRRDEEALHAGASARPRGLEVLRAWVDATRRNAGRPALIDLEVTLSAEAIAEAHPAHDYFVDVYERAEALLERAFIEIEQRDLLASGITASQAAQITLSATLGLQQLWLWEGRRDLAVDLEAVLGSLVTSSF